MSVKAKLIIDEKEINVLWFTFGFNQGADATGRPSQKSVFAGLKLIIETRKDLNLADWSFAPNETKQIELHIYPVILGGKTRKLYFYDCHLVNWINDFSSTDNQPMSETLNITAAGVKDSNFSTEYSAYWRTTFTQQEVEPTTINNNAEGVIRETYFEDAQGNKLDILQPNLDACLVIKTENMEGKSINADLSKHKVSFIYNGDILTNDILEDISISSGIKKVNLKTAKK